MKYIRVKKDTAECTRKRLLRAGLLDKTREVLREGTYVLFPVIGETPNGLGEVISREECVSRKMHPRWYGDVVTIPENLKGLLPRSLDIIGHIAILKVPLELEKYQDEIADAIIATNKSIRTVAVDYGVHGEDRIRRLSIIRGNVTETEYTEYGILMRLDPTKVFFTPRLGSERHRVASLVQPHERVLDMFAGVGPFGLHICKRVPTSEVYAVDSNPYAVEYMKINARLNKVKNLYPIHGKIEDVIQGLPEFNRIIMNLPMRSIEYLDIALEKLTDGWIHLYQILNMNEKDATEKISRRVRSLSRSAKTITPRRIKSYSPEVGFFVFDVRVTPT